VFFYYLPLLSKSVRNGSRETPKYAGSHEHFLLIKILKIMAKKITFNKAPMSEKETDESLTEMEQEENEK